jgi:hypothetical protein
VQQLVKNQITKYVVTPLNSAIVRLAAKAATEGGRATIDTIAIDTNGDALNVHITFSGQLPTKTVSGWFGGL